MISDVSAEGQAPRPRKGPERQGRVRVARFDLDRAPERQHFVGQMETDPGESRDGSELRVTQDKTAGRSGHTPDFSLRSVERHKAVQESAEAAAPACSTAWTTSASLSKRAG